MGWNKTEKTGKNVVHGFLSTLLFFLNHPTEFWKDVGCSGLIFKNQIKYLWRNVHHKMDAFFITFVKFTITLVYSDLGPVHYHLKITAYFCRLFSLQFYFLEIQKLHSNNGDVQVKKTCSTILFYNVVMEILFPCNLLLSLFLRLQLFCTQSATPIERLWTKALGSVHFYYNFVELISNELTGVLTCYQSGVFHSKNIRKMSKLQINNIQNLFIDTE